MTVEFAERFGRISGEEFANDQPCFPKVTGHETSPLGEYNITEMHNMKYLSATVKGVLQWTKSSCIGTEGPDESFSRQDNQGCPRWAGQYSVRLITILQEPCRTEC